MEAPHRAPPQKDHEQELLLNVPDVSQEGLKRAAGQVRPGTRSAEGIARSPDVRGAHAPTFVGGIVRPEADVFREQVDVRAGVAGKDRPYGVQIVAGRRALSIGFSCRKLRTRIISLSVFITLARIRHSDAPVSRCSCSSFPSRIILSRSSTS